MNKYEKLSLCGLYCGNCTITRKITIAWDVEMKRAC